ncbi:SGNH hydrolase-type esterase domain-containing protein [Paraphoma chrysanthemicola]|nr:SGNH hydrolase-type esterase domain-containing protein [Paraphoma chrysanthemicola]
MLYTQVASLLALAGTAFAAPSGELSKRAPTLYLAGDSTMAPGNGKSPVGWGLYAPYSLSITSVNKAIGGRSARSYTREGRFTEIINTVKSGDIVVIEFGHNDGGSLKPTDNGRSNCPGVGTETCQTTYNGVAETVHTFSWYLTEAGKAIIAKGAKVIISSQTPNNPWETGTFAYTDGGRFVGYARDVAKALGSNAMYVDHGAYTASYFKSIGAAKTNAFFPVDHTHTNPAGADAVSKAFFKGVQCAGGGFLKGYVKNATATIPGTCL